MRTVAAAALVLALSAPASAQCFAPGFGWGFGFGGPRAYLNVWGGPVLPPPVWGFGYGYSYSAVYVNPWVVAPPVMPVPLAPVPPGVFTIADDPPASGGVDLVALRQKLAREREDEITAEQRARAKVNAAVKNGELVVFEPGKPLAKRVEVPPAKVPDAPPVVAAKPPGVNHMQRGQAAFDAGELGRATEQFAAAVAADPKLGEAHFNLAQVRLARGQYAEAVDAIRTGMKNVPNWPEQKFRASDLYLTQPKRLAADVADLKAAMAAAPTDSTLSFLYAHHLWFSGEREKAGELFAKLNDKVKEKELVEPFTR
jgi:cytochrome c-type biogenesis protein CcmH/NrfG